MIVDWVSFTMPFEFITDEDSNKHLRYAAREAIDALKEILPAWGFLATDWVFARAQRPYTDATICANTGVTLHFARYRTECLVTISGKACAMLTDAGLMYQFMPLIAESGTRLDLAHDVETSLLPSDIMKHGISARFKSLSEVKSTTGETQYIGSRTSEFMARIYKYFPPHPRHKLLRFEFELKGETAQAAAQAIQADGLAKVMRGFGQRVGFQSKQAQAWFAGSSSKVRTVPHKRHLAKTELWLMKQAAPAFAKLVKEGVIDDPKGWLQQYFLGGDPILPKGK